MIWDEAQAIALAGQAVRRWTWQRWLFFRSDLWWTRDDIGEHVARADEFQAADRGASDWTTDDWAGADDVCGRPAPMRPLEMPQPQFDYCDVGAGFASIKYFAKLHGFPRGTIGSLPKTIVGDSLEGITQLGGSDIVSVDGYLVRSGSGGNAYDNAMMTFGVVRSDFEVTYEFFLDGQGGKHWVGLWAALDAHAPVLGIGGWEVSSGEVPLITLRRNQTSVVQEEFSPVEWPAVPDERDTWRTRGIRKKGPQIWFRDGSADWALLERCWLDIRGHLGMQIGPGVRVRNIQISEPM